MAKRDPTRLCTIGAIFTTALEHPRICPPIEEHLLLR